MEDGRTHGQVAAADVVRQRFFIANIERVQGGVWERGPACCRVGAEVPDGDFRFAVTAPPGVEFLQALAPIEIGVAEQSIAGVRPAPEFIDVTEPVRPRVGRRYS